MEDQKFTFSGSFTKAKEYLDTQVELLKLKAIAKTSRIVGALIVDATKLLLVFSIIFFLSLALGFYLGELLGSYSLGFLATGGIFFIILLIIRACEPQLESKFMDITIRKVLGKWNEEDEHLESWEKYSEESAHSEKSVVEEFKTESKHEDENK